MSIETESVDISFTIKSSSSQNETDLTDDCENKDEWIRKKIIIRRILIVVILAVVLVLIAVILIIKLPDLLNDTETSSTTISFNFNTGSTGMKYEPIITEVGRGGASGDPPCQSHTVIDDPTRSIYNDGFGGPCDNTSLLKTNLGGRWIRFVGKGGTRIPNTGVGRNHCGTFLALWLKGSLPLVNGTSVNASLCWFADTMTTCIQSTTNSKYSIMNCGDFYVYFLLPILTCNARYCTV